ncbi:MAG TPA: hypothetical protein VFF72_01255 [Caldimonas sp.]|nr:hypothetical protein [Caldimonas sp.]
MAAIVEGGGVAGAPFPGGLAAGAGAPFADGARPAAFSRAGAAGVDLRAAGLATPCFDASLAAVDEGFFVAFDGFAAGALFLAAAGFAALLAATGLAAAAFFLAGATVVFDDVFLPADVLTVPPRSGGTAPHGKWGGRSNAVFGRRGL